MKTVLYIVAIFSLVTIKNVYSQDWTMNATLPGVERCNEHNGHKVCLKNGNRQNIYKLTDNELATYLEEGGRHVLSYPVEVTPLQIPYASLKKFFNSETNSPLRRFFYSIAKELTSFRNIGDLYNQIGLHQYPEYEIQRGPNLIPNMGSLESESMGATIFGKENARGLTFSCAACHSANLFGKKIVGLTNRFPRANEFFHLGQKILKNTPALLYRSVIGASDDEMKLFKESKAAIKAIGIKKPIVLGLDTSLAQVGLSLAKRNQDEYATFSSKYQRRPRASGFDKNPADSKPAVWWNTKYKTKWLSDGSIISGNPIHTNFLWNEIGRGVDLKKLENWLVDNKNKVDELTSYVFNTEAPKYNEFFPRRIKIDRAQRGEKLFLKTCSGCHGVYTKGWDETEDYEKAIATTKVWYHKTTPVIDVGTDPLRYEGMKYFADDLNNLKISKSIKTVVKAQKGYVPPPLVGIWARWPYFHNNSAPTLYDVITPDFKRPKSYIAVESIDPKTDFDFVKNGYPHPSKIKEPFKSKRKYRYNTKIRGLSNTGHTSMLVDSNGQEKMTEDEKLDLIEFLKTL